VDRIGFNGILNLNFLLAGQTTTAVGVGTVELESPLERLKITFTELDGQL